MSSRQMHTSDEDIASWRDWCVFSDICSWDFPGNFTANSSGGFAMESFFTNSFSWPIANRPGPWVKNYNLKIVLGNVCGAGKICIPVTLRERRERSLTSKHRVDKNWDIKPYLYIEFVLQQSSRHYQTFIIPDCDQCESASAQCSSLHTNSFWSGIDSEGPSSEQGKKSRSDQGGR